MNVVYVVGYERARSLLLQEYRARSVSNDMLMGIREVPYSTYTEKAGYDLLVSVTPRKWR
jgi:hypothetical protein